jgi:hypothetical protein
VKAVVGGRAGDGETGLRELTATWEDVQRSRLAAEQRGLLPVAEALHKTETALARDIRKALMAHPLWDWLPSGLRGVHVARLVALIDDPWRFPGRRCTVGHYLSVAADDDESVGLAGDGDPCPVGTHEGSCTGTLLPPRSGSGVRSLWHYCGLHVVDGRSPRKRKGSIADWSPIARTVVLMPGGIAEQIVRQRVVKYRDTYDLTKDRLTRERGAAGWIANDTDVGDALTDGPAVETHHGIEMRSGLRPIQIEGIARKVAAKQFIGDLLIEWKHRTEVGAESVAATGPVLSTEAVA